MKFNINHTVKVKLTQHGRDVLHDNHRKLFARSAALHPYNEPTADAEGWTEFQLWELMAQFGAHLYNGGPLSFETTIEIPSQLVEK